MTVPPETATQPALNPTLDAPTALTEPLLAAEAGLAWLRSSGIQNPSGGYHSWFDQTTGEYPFLYSEVTGYQVTLAAWRAARGDGGALEEGGRAVAWLASAVQPTPGAFRCLEPLSESAKTMAKADRLYTFDAGIILQGLVAHHVATGDRLALETALATGEWLLEHVDEAGNFTPWPTFGSSGGWQEAPADWSTRPGVHHAKIGIGLAALGDLTGDRRYTDAAVASCLAALELQDPTGRFVTNPVTDSTNIHPHSYAAEALWAVGSATGRDDFIAASALATRWALEVTDEAGFPPRRWTPGEPAVRHPRVDGVAQVLRLASLHSLASSPEAQRVKANLLTHQVLASEEPRVHGGFSFGASSWGAPLPHVNVWVTAFAVQALVLSEEGPTLDWRHLV